MLWKLRRLDAIVESFGQAEDRARGFDGIWVGIWAIFFHERSKSCVGRVAKTGVSSYSQHQNEGLRSLRLPHLYRACFRWSFPCSFCSVNPRFLCIVSRSSKARSLRTLNRPSTSAPV